MAKAAAGNRSAVTEAAWRTPVFARALARIHETNLKKHGLLALTFRDPTNYECMAKLAPRRDVECQVTHVDELPEAIALIHPYSGAQLGWFRKGHILYYITRTS